MVQVLTQQADYQTARKYWNKLKERLSKEGSESVTNCHQLKLRAADGKNYLTDVATAETLLRLVQSVPSPKAEPIKLWLAKVGYGQVLWRGLKIGAELFVAHAIQSSSLSPGTFSKWRVLWVTRISFSAKA